jgi:penicillin-binding protein A
MNAPVRRLAMVAAAMFLALMMSATWVQFFQASDLNNDPRNVRTLYREFDNPRGPIVVAGESAASSSPVDDPYLYLRSYSDGALWTPATGFYSIV